MKPDQDLDVEILFHFHEHCKSLQSPCCSIYIDALLTMSFIETDHPIKVINNTNINSNNTNNTN